MTGEELGAISFPKVLTASDVTYGQLSLHKSCGEALFPLLGVTVSVRDVEGKVWRFKHGLSGKPPRDRLSREWGSFVREKGLAAGDTVVLKKNKAGELHIDVRRTSQPLAAERDRQTGESSELTMASRPDVGRLSGYVVGEASHSRPAAKRLKIGGEDMDRPSVSAEEEMERENTDLPSNPRANGCSSHSIVSPAGVEGISHTHSSDVLRPDVFPDSRSFRLFGKNIPMGRDVEEDGAQVHGGLSLDLNLPPPLEPAEAESLKEPVHTAGPPQLK